MKLRIENIDFMSSLVFVDWFSKRFTNFSRDKVAEAGFDFMHQLYYFPCGNEELKLDFDYLDYCNSIGNRYVPYKDFWEFVDAMSAELNINLRDLLLTQEELDALYADFVQDEEE